MPRCTVTLSANAGVSLTWAGRQIWVDALHDVRVPGFSTVTPALWAAMRAHPAFSRPDLICFTHCHEDHYSRRLTEEAGALWPGAALALPEREFEGQLLLQGDEVRLKAPPLTIRFLRLPHEGGMDVPHYGLLVSDGAFRLLLAGDCAVACPELARHLAGETVDAAILNFPWLTLNRGRRFLQDVLRPGAVLACHLPFPPDDTEGYLAAARRAAEGCPGVRLLAGPLQQATLG